MNKFNDFSKKNKNLCGFLVHRSRFFPSGSGHELVFSSKTDNKLVIVTKRFHIYSTLIVLLMGDHGYRRGEIRRTSAGEFEGIIIRLTYLPENLYEQMNN